MSKNFNKKIQDAVNEAVQAFVGDNAFVNMVSGLGTSRDKQAFGEYVSRNRMSVKALNNIYESDWIAERIITKPAYDAIRAGWYYSKLDEDTADLVINKSKDIDMQNVLLKVLSLSRLHGWAYIIIGANDSEDLSDELDLSKGDLQFLTVLNREQCSEDKDGGYVNAALAKGSYNEPVFYNIGTYYDKKLIHHSRVIRVDCPDPVGSIEDGKPTPILQRIEAVLKRVASSSANAGSLIYESKTDIFKVPHLLNNLGSRPAHTIKSIYHRFNSLATLKGNNGMIVMDTDEEYESKSFNFGGLSELMREFKVETAGAASMPYSILFGQSPAGLNSTGDFDMRSYYDSISIQQEHSLKRPIERIIACILEVDGLDADDIGLTFNSLWQLDDKTRSEVEKNNAERDAKYIELGVITESQVARQLVDDGTYTVIDEQHITLLEGMAGAYEYRDVDTVDGAGL